MFATCQVGAEIAVKADVAREAPGLRPAFQRPGLVTFKATPSWDPAATVPSPFVRACGASAGPAASVEAVVEAVRAVGRARLFVWPRDVGRPGHEPPALVEAARAHAEATEAALRATGRFEPAGLPAVGESVVDVITALDEPAMVGWHVHGDGHVPHPGGRYPLEVPADAPSRAWAKIAEADAWAKLPFRNGDIVLDIGGSPGGGARFLLDRGADVMVVDPEPLDPALVAAAGRHLRHLKKPMGAVQREELPAAQWILLDVGVAAPVALRAVRRFVPPLRKGLVGVVFTLKLADWGLAAQVPKWKAQIAELGFPDVRARQLGANRREICVVGLTGRRR